MAWEGKESKTKQTQGGGNNYRGKNFQRLRVPCVHTRTAAYKC